MLGRSYETRTPFLSMSDVEQTRPAFTPEDIYFVERLVRGIRCDPVSADTTYGELYASEAALRAQGEAILEKMRALPLPQPVPPLSSLTETTDDG